MKKFIVDTGKKKYSIEANDAEHAVKIVKKIICRDDITYRGFKIYKVDDDWEVKSSNGEMWNYDGRLTLRQVKAKLDKGIDKDIWDSICKDDIIDEASQLQTVNALIEDEKAAVEAYDVAIENLCGKIPEESLQAIIAIRDDENRHIENLQAVVNGTVTEKNLEDSTKDDTVMFPGSKLRRVAIKYGFLDNEELAKKIAADPEWQAIIKKYKDPLWSASSDVDKIVKKYK